jgi:hypothetical protein
MHRYVPAAPSEIDELEIAMLDLLLRANGVGSAPLTESAAAALADSSRVFGVDAPPAEVHRLAARILRDRAVGLGADAGRYRSMGWRSLGL